MTTHDSQTKVESRGQVADGESLANDELQRTISELDRRKWLADHGMAENGYLKCDLKASDVIENKYTNEDGGIR